MPSQRYQSTPDSGLMLRGICIMGLLWALAFWNSIALSSHSFVSPLQHNIAASADNVAVATNEHNFSLRSSKTFFSSNPQPDETVPLAWVLFIAALAIFLSRTKASTGYENDLLCAHRLQLQTLNISRAPPSHH